MLNKNDKKHKPVLKRNDKIIRHKMRQYLLPGILLTAALQIGNIVDTMLVGNLLGPEAMSAVKIGMTVDNIVELPGYVLGVGGSVAAGIFLGNREIDKAKKVFSTTLLISMLFGVFFALCSVGAGYYATWLCGGSKLVEDARRFILVTLLIAPIFSAALQAINYVAVDSSPKLASVYVITANVINLVMDYILLKYSPLGTAGAALSTGLGYGLGLILIIFYVKSKNRMLSFVNPLRGMGKYFLAALKAGVPTLLYMVFLTVKDLMLNTMVISMVGEVAMVIYTVCFNGMLCVQLFAGGIVGLLSNMGSVLYGKADFFGIKKLIRRLLRYSYITVGVFMAVMLVRPELFLHLFGVNDAEIVSVGTVALRIYTLSLPLYLWNHFMMIYYQSTEKTVLSSIIASLQTCVAIVPLAYVCVFAAMKWNSNPLNALTLSFGISELVTLLIAYLYQAFKYKDQNYFMIPKQKKDLLEFTLCNRSEQLCQAETELVGFCSEHQVPQTVGSRAAAVMKEFLDRIFSRGNAKNVDVAIRVTEDALHLQLTDDGIPYDPTAAEDEKQKKNADAGEQAKYLRVIDTNYTTVEFARAESAT